MPLVDQFWELYTKAREDAGKKGFINLEAKDSASPTASATREAATASLRNHLPMGIIQNNIVAPFLEPTQMQKFEKATASAQEVVMLVLTTPGEGDKPRTEHAKKTVQLVDFLLTDAPIGAFASGGLADSKWTPYDVEALRAFYFNDAPTGEVGEGVGKDEVVEQWLMSRPLLDFVARECVGRFVRSMIPLMEKTGPQVYQWQKSLLMILDDAELAEIGRLTPQTLSKMAELSKVLAAYLYGNFGTKDRMMWLANLIKKNPEAFGALSIAMYRRHQHWTWTGAAHLVEEKWREYPHCLQWLLDQLVRRCKEDDGGDACDLVGDRILLNETANRLAPVVVADEAADRLAQVCTSVCAAVCG
jgi:hypothetical protein